MSSRKELANAIRILSIDAIQKAKSGHPGAPMGMADIAEVLWREFLNHNPLNPAWFNRDRFVLSNGHGSMLIYSLLHLSGYNLPMSEIKKFRQLCSQTPGHPEFGNTIGVETTTGPLGQGLANAVGMAIAERTLAAQFNRPGHNIVDHYTYAFMGDGCLMEGISHEVCSLAGTLKLGKLITFYDNNGISIDGDITGWFTDNTAKRFESYGWHIIPDVDGHNHESISNAIKKAVNIIDKPSIIICKTIIGFGSPNKAGKNDIHGAPLGESEIAATRKFLNWNYPPFIIPKEIYLKWDARETGLQKETAWNNKFANYQSVFPHLASELMRRQNNQLPDSWDKITKNFIKKLQTHPDNIAGRKASQNILECFGILLPEYLGGSADLSPSNLTMWSGSRSIDKDTSGNYIHYGVREFGMTAIANGIALHRGFLAYTATFLTFVEYARNAVRMAALMKIRQVMIYTHDSIGLGEDGPTHQPVEQLASLRLTPNLSTWRPCDQVECAVAWKYAIERLDGPTALIFSRQILPQQHRSMEQLSNVARGGYVLKSCIEQPDIIIIATGSEVDLAVSAYLKLSVEGYNVRIVSMPSPDVFDLQDEIYRETVLPKTVNTRIAIEAGMAEFWYKYVGLNGAIIGMHTFGESAPADILFNFFGFNLENVIRIVRKLLKNNNIA
ncbi:MAG: transketolase [Candidatus Dasytiphilus stammeri]